MLANDLRRLLERLRLLRVEGETDSVLKIAERPGAVERRAYTILKPGIGAPFVHDLFRHRCRARGHMSILSPQRVQVPDFDGGR